MSAIKTRFDDRLTQTRWRLRNRDRSGPSAAPSELADLIARLRRDGVVITDFESVFGETALFDEAAAEVQRRYEARPRQDGDAAAGSKGTFLTKLGDPSYDLGQVFARIALHPRALAVANGYLNLRSTLRALDVWHTHPTAGPAIQTQLWHRDGDDVVNAKMFVYFTDVRAPAGPLMYAPGTHPYGSRRELPEHDDQARSNDEQLARGRAGERVGALRGEPGHGRLRRHLRVPQAAEAGERRAAAARRALRVRQAVRGACASSSRASTTRSSATTSSSPCTTGRASDAFGPGFRREPFRELERARAVLARAGSESSASRRSASRSAGTSSAGTRNPLPSIRSCAAPDSSVATSGRPAAAASFSTIPQGSECEGRTKTSASR